MLLQQNCSEHYLGSRTKTARDEQRAISELTVLIRPTHLIYLKSIEITGSALVVQS